jgi:dCTP deaminase
VVVNVTPFEPEWEGYATISLSNTAGVPVRVYANEGVAQLIFLEADQECLQSYKDKKGKYQAQKSITLSKSD